MTEKFLDHFDAPEENSLTEHPANSKEVIDRQYAVQKLEQIIASRQRINTVARLLDTYHLDGLVGLLLGAGDLTTGLAGSYILVEAIRCGLPKTELLKMVVRIIIDVAAGTVPGVGDILDFFYKSNKKNRQIFENWLKEKYLPELRRQNIPIPPQLESDLK